MQAIKKKKRNHVKLFIGIVQVQIINKKGIAENK